MHVLNNMDSGDQVITVRDDEEEIESPEWIPMANEEEEKTNLLSAEEHNQYESRYVDEDQKYSECRPRIGGHCIDQNIKTKEEIEKELTYRFRAENPIIFALTADALDAIGRLGVGDGDGDGDGDVEVYGKGGGFGSIRKVEEDVAPQQHTLIDEIWRKGDIDCEIKTNGFDEGRVDSHLIKQMVDIIDGLMINIHEYLVKKFKGIQLKGTHYVLSTGGKRSNVQWISDYGDRVVKYYPIKNFLVSTAINNLRFPDVESGGINHFNILRLKVVVEDPKGTKILLELLDICHSYAGDHKRSNYKPDNETYKPSGRLRIWIPEIAIQAEEFERMANQTKQVKYVQRGGFLRFWKTIKTEELHKINANGWRTVLEIKQCSKCGCKYVVRLTDRDKEPKYCKRWHV